MFVTWVILFMLGIKQTDTSETYPLCVTPCTERQRTYMGYCDIPLGSTSERLRHIDIPEWMLSYITIFQHELVRHNLSEVDLAGASYTP